MKSTDTPHQPVLLKAVVDVLAPKSGETYLDGTAGFGGHAAAIAKFIAPSGRLILVDRDQLAISALQKRFGEEATIVHDSFPQAAQNLAADKTLVDMILLDLGVSSPQFDNAERGFSFRADASLDMRMDQSQELTAEHVVNTWSQPELEDIIHEYGEEPRARAVARAIIAARPLHTTGQLAQIVRRSAYGTSKIDPATRTFQALRIAVNDELNQLKTALPILVSLLAPGGRIGVISFHSLEDRIVKQFFDQEVRDCICPPKQPVCTCGHVASLVKITRSPITADATELTINPRSRSAKLRVAENINKNKRRD